MLHAYLYLRVSGLGQVDGYGFDRQEEACRVYCSQHGIEVAGVYRDEGVSGTREEIDRPAFSEMMTAILSNGVSTVVVESLDRLAREYRIQEQLLTYLAAKGITLINARTGEDVTQALQADPLKRAMVQMQGVFAELEKNQLVRRLKKGRERAKAKTGRCEGRKPYGDTAEEQAVIRRMRAMRRKGKAGAPGLTFQQIADRLNSDGILTKTGKQWTAGLVHGVLSR